MGKEGEQLERRDPAGLHHCPSQCLALLLWSKKRRGILGARSIKQDFLEEVGLEPDL